MPGGDFYGYMYRKENAGGGFSWADENDYLLWSGVCRGDSIVAVGYKPSEIASVKGQIHLVDLKSYEWQYARAYTIAFILDVLNENSLDKQVESDIFVGEASRLPILYLKLADYQALAQMRRLGTVRYVEPIGFDPRAHAPDASLRSGSGCNGSSSGGESDAGFILNDHTIPVAGNNRASWHIGPNGHRVSNAWNHCPQGNGITMAIIDTGIETDNEQLNADFDEGASAGRTLQILNAFNTPIDGAGTDDLCGHGTRIAAIAAHPRGNDGSITGVAYRANLVAYRASNDVILNTPTERVAVIEAFSDAADNPNIHIISMSMGSMVKNDAINDAIEDAWGEGKLIFLAAGSALGWDVHPAKSTATQTYAVTAIQYDANNPLALDDVTGAAIGSFIDFSTYMQTYDGAGGTIPYAVTCQRDDGGAFAWSQQTSGATATCAGIAALVWSVDPTLSRNQVVSHLISASSRGTNRDPNYGYGIINAEAAVLSASSLQVSILGPTLIQTSGTFTWTANVTGPGVNNANLNYYWDQNTATNNASYMPFISVPPGTNETRQISLTVSETVAPFRSSTTQFSYQAQSGFQGF